MSDLVEEDYNASNLAAVKFTSAETDTIFFPADATQKPGIVLPPSSKRLEAYGSKVPIYRLAFTNSISILDDKGNPVFVNGSLDNLPDPSWLKKKAGPVFPDGTTLWRELPRDASGRLILGGIVLVSSDLEIDRPVEITGGGIILVQGGILIKSRIGGPSHDPISLVALNGDINVETSDTVSGRLRLGKTARIEGSVAARELAPVLAKPFTPRTILYNTAFDPTDLANYRRSYRLMTWGKGVTFVR